MMIYGRHSDELSDAQVDRIQQVIVNVASPSRMPVRAKVFLIEPTGRSDLQMCGISVGDNVYFVGIIENILFIMDLVDFHGIHLQAQTPSRSLMGSLGLESIPHPIEPPL